MIKAIIFDFAGVIGSEGYSIYLKEKLPDYESKKLYYGNLADSLDRGDITYKQFSQTIGKEIGIDSDIVWKEIFERIKINYDLLKLITQLKKKYKIGLLTNYNHEPLKIVFDRHRLDKYFDIKTISSIYRTIKPGKEIYEISLREFKIKPEEAIFVDDRQKNVDGGEAVGIKSFLFTTTSKLREDLINYGISL